MAPETPVASGRSSAVVRLRHTTLWTALAAGGTLVAFAAYALLSHWLMTHAAREPWAVAVLFGPLLLAVAGGALGRRQWPLLAACGAVVALLGLVVARGGVDDANRLYVLQHGGIHLMLAWTFGNTLRRGSTPLITALAHTVHIHFTPAMQAYTRWLTGVWAVYFLGMTALSLLIYALAPWPWWSLYCNVLTPLLAVAVFGVEHVLRYRRHPDFERVSMRNAIAAYRLHAAEAAETLAPRP